MNMLLEMRRSNEAAEDEGKQNIFEEFRRLQSLCDTVEYGILPYATMIPYDWFRSSVSQFMNNLKEAFSFCLRICYASSAW